MWLKNVSYFSRIGRADVEPTTSWVIRIIIVKKNWNSWTLSVYGYGIAAQIKLQILFSPKNINTNLVVGYLKCLVDCLCPHQRLNNLRLFIYYKHWHIGYWMLCSWKFTASVVFLLWCRQFHIWVVWCVLHTNDWTQVSFWSTAVR